MKNKAILEDSYLEIPKAVVNYQLLHL